MEGEERRRKFREEGKGLITCIMMSELGSLVCRCAVIDTTVKRLGRLTASQQPARNLHGITFAADCRQPGQLIQKFLPGVPWPELNWSFSERKRYIFY